MLKIIQIVPRLRPAIDGVGDYALILAKSMRDQYGVETVFLICDPEWRGEDTVDGFLILKLSQRRTHAFLNCIPEMVQRFQIKNILLHYVGYGYSSEGAPVWLVESLEKFKAYKADIQLVSMFHEIAATSFKPWTRTFWNQGLQRKCATRLAVASDVLMTNTTPYKNQLHTMTGRDEITVLPVISNIGIPSSCMKWQDRRNEIVLWGRSTVWVRQKSSLINRIVRRCKINHLTILGDKTGSLTALFDSNLRVHCFDYLEAAKLSELLSFSKYGFILGNSQSLGKSGQFAANAAHGLVSFISNFDGDADGLQMGRHYLNLNRLSEGCDFEYVSKECRQWYLDHDLLSQVGVFRKKMIEA